jgi:hypothetical protein
VDVKSTRAQLTWLCWGGFFTWGLLSTINILFMVPAILWVPYFEYRRWHLKCPHCRSDIGLGEWRGLFWRNPGWVPDDDIRCRHCGMPFESPEELAHEAQLLGRIRPDEWALIPLTKQENGIKFVAITKAQSSENGYVLSFRRGLLDVVNEECFPDREAIYQRVEETFGVSRLSWRRY